MKMMTINRIIALAILILLIGIFTTGESKCNNIQTDTISSLEDNTETNNIQPSITIVDIVADVIYENMIPDREANGYITEEEAYLAANEIVYCMDLYEMKDEDLQYILSLFYCESKFDPRARYYYGCGSCASGFGQIMGIHAWKFPCEHERSWRDCIAWKDVEHNIYVAFDIMAYPEYAHIDIDRRWRNIYRYNYNTSPGSGWIGVQYHSMFDNILDEKLLELEVNNE